jgi:hypothetical protein
MHIWGCSCFVALLSLGLRAKKRLSSSLELRFQGIQLSPPLCAPSAGLQDEGAVAVAKAVAQGAPGLERLDFAGNEVRPALMGFRARAYLSWELRQRMTDSCEAPGSSVGVWRDMSDPISWLVMR